MAPAIDLDHVAIALRDVGPTLNTLVGRLGGTVLFGGMNFGFRAMQVQCGDLRVELLEPHNVEQNDFLARFLDANGEGPHHLTFKTDDIERELDRFASAGYTPVGVNIDNPFWREAFIHPKQARGTVVQIAESAFDDPTDIDLSLMPTDRGPAKWWPDTSEPAGVAANLARVVVTTDEMTKAIELYADLLRGDRGDHGEGWVELTWPGRGRVRVEHAAGRSEGIDRLEWTHAGQPEDLTVGGTRFVLDPERR